MDDANGYGAIRLMQTAVAETPGPVPENVVQHIWREQRFATDNLETDTGRALEIVSPGWWNQQEGPDFREAQIRFNGRLRTGDVEIHLGHGAWRSHGHERDPRYDGVLLNVVLDKRPPQHPPHTSQGRRVPCLLLESYLREDVSVIAAQLGMYGQDAAFPPPRGQCGDVTERIGRPPADELVQLAGHWRMIHKAQALRRRMEQTDADQAIYEALMEACGYSRYKRSFRLLAEQLPYARLRQLAGQDAGLAEAALLHLAGLLPKALAEDAPGHTHFSRLQTLREQHLPGLRPLQLEWKRLGARPANYPERRLSGMARLIARTAQDGLVGTLDRIWRGPAASKARREALEALFPRAIGFWAGHCTWDGKKMARPIQLLGEGRIRVMVGNVFIPAAVAVARERRDRLTEEEAAQLYATLPKEPDNQVLKVMIPRIYGEAAPKRLNFRMQQGLMQLFYDWCQPNPSCRNCPVSRGLEHGFPSGGPGGDGR